MCAHRSTYTHTNRPNEFRDSTQFFPSLFFIHLPDFHNQFLCECFSCSTLHTLHTFFKQIYSQDVSSLISYYLYENVMQRYASWKSKCAKTQEIIKTERNLKSFLFYFLLHECVCVYICVRMVCPHIKISCLVLIFIARAFFRLLLLSESLSMVRLVYCENVHYQTHTESDIQGGSIRQWSLCP